MLLQLLLLPQTLHGTAIYADIDPQNHPWPDRQSYGSFMGCVWVREGHVARPLVSRSGSSKAPNLRRDAKAGSEHLGSEACGSPKKWSGLNVGMP